MHGKNTGQSDNRGYRPLPKPMYGRNQNPRRRRKRPKEVKGVIPKIKHFFIMVLDAAMGDNGKSGKRKQRRKKVSLAVPVVTFAVLVLLISGIVRMLTVKNSYEVYVGEKKLGAVAMAKNVTADSLADSLFDTAVKKLESEYGAKLQASEKVTAEAVHTSKNDLVTSEHIISEISKSLTYKVQAAIITVDGREMAVLKNQADADAVLKRITSQFVKEDDDSVVSEGFVENVAIDMKYVDKEEIVTSDAAYRDLTATVDANETYVVQSGDSLWGIASRLGMSLDELLSKNPDVDPDIKLKVGTEIVFLVTKPLLSVKTVEKATYTETEPRPVDIKENSGEYKTYSSVIQEGKDGEREVTVHITKINGQETGEKEIVDSKVTVPPVTEIKEVGTSQTVPKR